MVRLEVAKSGDLAYEFSNFKAEYLLKDQPGKPEQFTGSLLRVWKKDGGRMEDGGALSEAARRRSKVILLASASVLAQLIWLEVAAVVAAHRTTRVGLPLGCVRDF